MIVKAADLKREHQLIERELFELETVMQTSIINYPNLYHVLNKLKSIWDSHESKEETYFNDLYKKGFTIPVKKITFEHGILRRDLNNLLKASNSGNDTEMHTLLFKYGHDLIKKIRQHMADEDWILYALPERL